MAWRALTIDDIQTGITAPELAAARTAVLGVGQNDPLTDGIQSATDQMRGYIAGAPSLVLGPEGTIPDKLINCGVDLVVYYLCKRLPGKILLKPERQFAYERAISQLRDVAAGRFRFEVPAEVSTEQIAVPLPSISNKLRPRTEGSIGV